MPDSDPTMDHPPILDRGNVVWWQVAEGLTMNVQRWAGAVVVGILVLGFPQAAAQGVSRDELPGEPRLGSLWSLIDLRQPATLLPGLRAGMFSSSDPEGRGRDHGNYLRRDGIEHVLADIEGPGTITRIWSANPQGQLRVYLDGATEPAVDCRFDDLFHDLYPPFQAPISGTSSGGSYSYWPIGFERSCRITVHEPPEIKAEREATARPRHVSIPLDGVKTLTLEVTTGGDDFGADHAVWADAKFVRHDGSVLYLSDLTDESGGARLVSTKQGWGALPEGGYGRDGAMGRDATCEGKPIVLGGTPYAKGLGSHSPAEHVYALDEEFERFESWIGVDDSKAAEGQGSVEFRIVADGELVYESGVVGHPKQKIAGSLDPEALYYHVNYLVGSVGTPVEPFRREVSPVQTRARDAVLAAWGALGEPPLSLANDEVVESDAALSPGETVTPITLSGTGEVTSIRIAVDAEDPRAWRRLVLRIFCDGEAMPRVWCPVGDFFGTGFGPVDFQSLLFGMAGNEGYCYAPMPFRDGLRVEVENGSRGSAQLRVRLTHHRLSPGDVPPGRFCAEWRSAVSTEGVLYEVLATRGRGAFLGFNLSVMGVGDCLGYLEGNEQFFVDGEEQPSTLGTGTEDYFSGGWYYREGLFTRPLHGLTVKRRSKEFGEASAETSQFRVQLPDCVPYRESLVARIEAGSGHIHIDDRYASVAYWYQKEPRRSTFAPPRASEMNFPRKVLVRPAAADQNAARGNDAAGVTALVGAEFAESFFDRAEVRHGSKRLAFWKDISEGYEGTHRALFTWWPRAYLLPPNPPEAVPAGDVILCEGNAAGLELAIPFEKPADGAASYRLTAVLVKGPDFGNADVMVGDEVVMADVDCRSEEVRPSQVLTAEIDGAQLGNGPVTVRVRAVGDTSRFGVYCVGLGPDDGQ